MEASNSGVDACCLFCWRSASKETAQLACILNLGRVCQVSKHLKTIENMKIYQPPYFPLDFKYSKITVFS